MESCLLAEESYNLIHANYISGYSLMNSLGIVRLPSSWNRIITYQIVSIMRKLDDLRIIIVYLRIESYR